MLTLLVALSLGAEPGTFTVTQSFYVARVVPAKPHQAAPRFYLPAGYHEHECPRCGARWGHGSDSYGKQSEHTCPDCGVELPKPWRSANGLKLVQ